MLACAYQGPTNRVHRHFTVGHRGKVIDYLVLQEYHYDGGQTDQGCEGTEHHPTSLHTLYQSLQGAFVHQLDGEDINHRHTTGIDTQLSRPEERIVEQEIDSRDTEQHEQQERSCPHDPLGRHAHHGRCQDDDSEDTKHYHVTHNLLLCVKRSDLPLSTAVQQVRQ